MATLGDALLIKLGLDPSGFKQSLNDAVKHAEQKSEVLRSNADKATTHANANIAKINQQASSTLNNVLGLAKRLAGPVTAALSFGAMIKSYWGGMGQVASMTGAYYKQLDAWREKMAALRRYTREDLELYRRTNRSMTDFRIAMADLSAEMMRSFNPLWRVGLDALEKFTKFISEHKEDVCRFLKIVAVIITTALIPAFIKLAATMLANPITWVIGLILALALAIDDLVVYLQGGESLFGDFWQPCVEGAKKAWEWIKNFWDSIKDSEAVQIAKDAIASFVDTATGLFDTLCETLSLVWDGIKRLFEIGEAAGVFQNLADVAIYFFTVLTNGLSVIYSLFDTVFSAVIGLVTGDFNKLEKAWDKLCENFKSLFESVVHFLTAAVNEIFSIVGSVAQSIMELGAKIANALDISGLIDKAKSKIAGFVDALPDFLKTDSMKEWAVNVKNGTNKDQDVNTAGSKKSENVTNKTFWNANEPQEVQYPHKRDANGRLSFTPSQALEPRLRMIEDNLSKTMPAHTKLARDSMNESVMNNIHNNGGNKNVTNNFTINSATPEMAKTAIETANDVGGNNISVANSMMATS